MKMKGYQDNFMKDKQNLKEELKPCPFCGGKAYKETTYPTDYPNWNTRSRVYCDACGAEIEINGNIKTCQVAQEVAVNRWNRRVNG